MHDKPPELYYNRKYSSRSLLYSRLAPLRTGQSANDAHLSGCGCNRVDLEDSREKLLHNRVLL